MNRRVVVDDRGGPELLRIVQEIAPEPNRDEVRVNILATGVSYADLLMREGVHPETPHGTITLGWDLAGIIDKFGSDVGDGNRQPIVRLKLSILKKPSGLSWLRWGDVTA